MDPTTQPLPPLDTLNLGSISAILAVTAVIVSVLKRVFGDAPIFRAIPLFVYVTVVATILTVLASQVFHTLPGDIKSNIWAAIVAALGSSGFYTWLTGKSSKSIGEAESGGFFPGPPMLLLPLLLAVAGGCAETKSARAYQLRAIFKEALADAKELHDAKIFTGDAYRTFVEAADIVAPILDELDRIADAEAVAKADGNIDPVEKLALDFRFEQVWSDVRPKVVALVVRVAKNLKPNGNTKPVSRSNERWHYMRPLNPPIAA